MKKEVFLLGFLVICIAACSQNTCTTSKRNQKLEESQSSDINIYCEDEIEAYFPGGVKNWVKAVTGNFRMKVLMTNKVPTGTYSVSVTFMITKNGTISDVKANTNFGYGIEDEIIRAIKKCPEWKPATNCRKKINSYQQQVITIVVA
jgi:protein TonB